MGSPSSEAIGDAPTEIDPDATMAAPDGAPPPESPSPLQRGAAVGRYTVLSELGAGGMGVVYLAYDPELDRQVALKLLRHRHGSGPGKTRARARLLREAQALARLSHPNVVTVYDTGEHEDEVWLAMELIQGHTLSEWARLEVPRWTERLRVLLDAGRGVAAAHAAGLVHRDLKPSNVMVGRSGRVRVMDFGLARARDVPSTDPEADAEPDANADVPVVTPSGSTEPLTRTHDVVGTPAYMAPEQWDGGLPDVRADQFSWCMLAWETLYGQRPFGDRVTSILVADRVLEPPRHPPGGRVPKWVRRVLETGLARNPDERWPSMDALLRAIERRRSRRRLQWITGVLSTIFVIGLVVNLAYRIERKGQAKSCARMGDTIEILWPGRAPELAAALRGSDAGYVRRLEGALTPRLDQWAREWSRVRTSACEAQLLREEIDQERRNRVEACLQMQRIGLATFIDMIVREDDVVLRRAPFMSTVMPPVSDCEDPAWLERLPMPRLDDIGVMHDGPTQWLRAATLEDAGRYEEALEAIEAVLERAKEERWDPLTARARLLRGELFAKLGRYRDAERALQQTYFEAGADELPTLAAIAAAQLVSVVGAELARPEDGLAWADHARMMIELADRGEGREQLLLLDGEAQVRRRSGDLDGALSLFEQALEIRRRSLGADHPQVGAALRDLAGVHVDRGEHEEAEALAREALALLEQALGDDHPEVAKALHGLGDTLQERDEAQARVLYERAIAIMEQTLGPEHPDLARPLNALGTLDLRRGMWGEAQRRHERALAVLERALPEDHPQRIEATVLLAALHQERGQWTEAAELLERAIEMTERGLGSEHPLLADLLVRQGSVHRVQEQYEASESAFERARGVANVALGGEPGSVARVLGEHATTVLARGDLPRAERMYRDARRMMTTAWGPDDPRLAHPIAGLADVALARGEVEDAMVLAREAEGRLDVLDDPPAMAGCRFTLARARWTAGERGAEVVALGRAAAATYRRLGPARQRQLRTVVAWLDSVDPSSRTASDTTSVESP